MSLTEIQVYDQFQSKLRKIPILPESDTISTICEKLEPFYQIKMITLYDGKTPLHWNSTFKFIEEKHRISSKILFFNFIFYTLEETQRRLQKDEFQIKYLIELGKLKTYTKEDETLFRAYEIHSFIQTESEKVTFRLTSETTRLLRERVKANLIIMEETKQDK
ncbi:MAG: hypothetical protein AABZ60_09060 [Planctomycetota bacterium]